MEDESRLIAAEAAVSAVTEPPRRRFFSGRRKSQARQLRNCENCGAPLAGPFCAQCGQHAVDYRRSLWRVLADAADSFLNWDTKFLSTLGVLLTRPWRLTNDFNAGRRVRYVHPLRLYLLASVAFFLIAKLVHFNPAAAIQIDPKDRAAIDAALAKLSASDTGLSSNERAKIEAARAKLTQIAATASGQDREELQTALRTLVRVSVKQKLKENDRAKIDAALDRVAEVPLNTSTLPEETAVALSPPPAASKATESTGHQFSKENKRDFENWMESRIKEKIGEGGTKMQLFLETLRSNIPTMMLCCIPLFAFVLKLLYLRQRRYYVEHLIYALHIHSFAYVAVVVITLLAMMAVRSLPGAEGAIIGVLSGASIVLVFLSIRRVYRQGWILSTFKFLVGGVAYFVILVIAVGATAFITLLLPG